MKLANIAYLLTLGIAISLSSTGCKKGLDKTTNIPGRGAGQIADASPTTRNSNIGDSTPIIPGNTTPGGDGIPKGTGVPALGTTGEGIATTEKNFDKWIPDRDTFKEQTIYFEFDKALVKASEVPKLEEVARRMKTDFVGKALRIEGHCDERGTEEYNRALGDRRALSIREKLAALGVDPSMLPTISFGEEHPADPGHNDKAFEKNRRGELILLSPPAAGAN